jgi:hypothetical protein
VLPVLRTIPGEVIGPGHNSVVRGPANLEHYCIYHRWSHDLSARVMAIDRLDWAGERLLVLGPSTTPQPAPVAPAITDFFDPDEQHALGPNWACAGGHWSMQQGAAVQADSTGTTTARCRPGGSYYVAEVSVRMVDAPGAEGLQPQTGTLAQPSLRAQEIVTPNQQPATTGGAPAGRYSSVVGHHEPATQVQTAAPATETGHRQGAAAGAYGIDLGDNLQYLIEPARHRVTARVRRDDGSWQEEQLALPPDFDPRAYHLLRLEVNGSRARLAIDDVVARWSATLARVADRRVALCTTGQAAAFAGFALTLGWEDLFVEPVDDPVVLGWASAQAGWQVAEGELRQSIAQDHALIVKGPHLESYDLAVNARLLTRDTPGAGYGFCPAVSSTPTPPVLAVEWATTGWKLLWHNSRDTRAFELPSSFDPAHYQQFRLRREGEMLHIAWETLSLGSLPLEPGPAQIGLYVHQAVAAFDMVRLMALA